MRSSHIRGRGRSPRVVARDEAGSAPRRRPGRLVASTAAISAVSLLAASGVATAARDTAASRHPSAKAGVAKLVFWDWSPGMSRAVALFNKTHPKIQVTLSDVGAGNAEYVKLADAIKAGTGAPDIAEVEYDELPSFEITHSVLDLSKYGANAYQKDFVPWVWSDVTSGGQVWGMPDDSGPLALLYNSAIFAKDKITPPATWAQFATDAAIIHKDNPKSYITNFSAGDLQWVLSLMAQDNAYPFKYTGGSNVTINFTGPAQTAFANYWQPLISKGLVNDTSDVSLTSFTDMDNGTDASWLSSGWGPSYMSADVKKTTGLWRTSYLPQWKAGGQVGANWGGSSFPVIASTKYPAQAATFSEWMSSTLNSWNIQVSSPTLNFPSFKPELDRAAFVNQTIPLTGPQKLHVAFVKSAKTASTVEWPPFMTEALTVSATQFAPVGTGKETLKQAFAAFQKTLVTYAKSEGFKVTT